VILRLFNTKLIRPVKQKSCESSPKLNITSTLRTRYNVHERVVNKIHVYDISRKESRRFDGTSLTPTSHLHIYYFVGSGWESPPSSHHYRFVRRLLHCLSSSTVISIVSYPLAPKNTVPKAFPILLEFCRKILQSRGKGEKVILAGDSAGGNIVLSLTLELLRLNPDCLVPNALLLISPAVDLAHENPTLRAVEKNDPLLRLKFVKALGKTWAGDWDVASDSRVSPIRAKNLEALEARGVAIYGVTGSYDILTPDALILRDMLLVNKVKGRWLHWEGAMHCFPLMAGYGLFCAEVRGAFNWIVSILQEAEADHDSTSSRMSPEVYKLAPSSTSCQSIQCFSNLHY
jgi:acetyl esterase/lipase